MSEMNLEMIKIKDIKPYELNSKIHTDIQIGKIRDNIIANGYNDPIALDENNEIIEGHGRLQALKQIFSDKEKEIKILRLIGLDEGQKIAYRIAHNKIGMETDFDSDLLKQDFEKLDNLKVDLDLTGFDYKAREILNIENSESKDSKNSELNLEDIKANLIHTCPRCNFKFGKK